MGAYQGVPSFKTKEELGRILVKEILELRKSNETLQKIDYEVHLDESFGEIDVCGLKFSTSEALKELDPIAYSNGMYEWSIEIAYQELMDSEDD